MALYTMCCLLIPSNLSEPCLSKQKKKKITKCKIKTPNVALVILLPVCCNYLHFPVCDLYLFITPVYLEMKIIVDKPGFLHALFK